MGSRGAQRPRLFLRRSDPFPQGVLERWIRGASRPQDLWNGPLHGVCFSAERPRFWAADRPVSGASRARAEMIFVFVFVFVFFFVLVFVFVFARFAGFCQNLLLFVLRPGPLETGLTPRAGDPAAVLKVLFHAQLEGGEQVPFSARQLRHGVAPGIADHGDGQPPDLLKAQRGRQLRQIKIQFHKSRGHDKTPLLFTRGIIPNICSFVNMDDIEWRIIFA